MSDVDDRDTVIDTDADVSVALKANDVPDREFGEQDVADAVADEPGSVAESLRGLIVYLVENLVDDPTVVDIDVDQQGAVVQITVHVPQDDLGKVIGRGGRIAKAMRTALMIAGSRHHVRVSLDIEGKTERQV